MVAGIFSWIIAWLWEFLGGIQGRLWFAFLVFFSLYTVFTFWSYRFSIRSVGVREATFSQAISIRLVELVLIGVLFLFGFLFPWGIFILLIARTLAFMVFFKAEFGKALFGVFISLILAAIFSGIYLAFLTLWILYFKRPPF